MIKDLMNGMRLKNLLSIKVRKLLSNLEIKADDPERRKAFRARHNCDQKTDKTTPGYWSCKMW